MFPWNVDAPMILARQFGLSPAAVVLPFLWVSDLAAQDRAQVIDDLPRCGSCELTLESTTTIYDREGTAGMSPPAPQDVLRTSSGHMVVITTNPSRPLLFDRGGTFIGRLGPEGEGPGEFRLPRSVVQGTGDTVWVLDSGLQRRTAWSADGSYLGVQRPIVNLPAEAVVLSDGAWVFSGLVLTPASIGLPLHSVDAGGNVTSSFGPEVDVDPTDHPPIWIRRNLTAADDGTFWAVWRYQYELSKYDSRGTRVGVIERVAEWFPELDPSGPWTLADDGPRGGAVGLVESDQGLLKTLVTLPGDNWRDGLGDRELQPGFEAAGVYWTPIRDFGKVYSFVIEVIDPERGELLYRERFNGLALGWVDNDHIATYRQDALDIPIIEIHRVEFTDARQ